MLGAEAEFLDLRCYGGVIVTPWRENANLVEAESEEKEALAQPITDVSQSSSSQNGHEDSVLASRFGLGSVGQVVRSDEEKGELQQR